MFAKTSAMNKFRTLINVTILSPLFFIAVIGNLVPVIPNQCRIVGVVLEYAIVSSRLIDIQPDQTLYRVIVHIESSENIGNMSNLIKGKEGQDIPFYTKETLAPGLFGKRIKATAIYKGDERGGIFWISNVEINGEIR
jgi:hypothetical protein